MIRAALREAVEAAVAQEREALRSVVEQAVVDAKVMASVDMRWWNVYSHGVLWASEATLRRLAARSRAEETK